MLVYVPSCFQMAEKSCSKHTDPPMATKDLSEGKLLCFKCLGVGPRTSYFLCLACVHHVTRVTVVFFGLVLVSRKLADAGKKRVLSCKKCFIVSEIYFSAS